MTGRSVTKLAAVAIILVVGILFLNVTDEQDTSTAGDLLLPDLMGKANALDRVVISDADGSTTIVRVDDQWTIAERGNFPANATALRELVLELAEAQAIEEKTANPDRYAQLGVEDGPDASGQRVTLAGEDFEFNVILGNEAQSNYRYARLQGDVQSWLIDANPEIPESASEWLIEEIIDIGASDVRAVTISHTDGETLRVSKTSEEDTDFQVESVPAGRELTYASVGNGIGGALSGLRLDDVMSHDHAPEDALAVTTFEMFDGSTVVVRSFEIGEETWHAVAESEADGEGSAAERPWLYKLPDYKRNLLLRRWEDILKEEEDAEDE